VATVLRPRRRVNLERRLSRADVHGNVRSNYLSHICIVEKVIARTDWVTKRSKYLEDEV
jgi:hypothetical protein